MMKGQDLLYLQASSGTLLPFGNSSGALVGPLVVRIDDDDHGGGAHCLQPAIEVMLLLAACLWPSSAMIHFGPPRPALQRHGGLMLSRACPVMVEEQSLSSSAFTECPDGADECSLPETTFDEDDRAEAELKERAIDFVLLATPIVLPILAGLQANPNLTLTLTLTLTPTLTLTLTLTLASSSRRSRTPSITCLSGSPT